MPSVLETIDSGTQYLEKRGIEDARLSMQLMVAERLGCTRMQLYLDFDKPLAEDTLAPLRADLKKRGEGIPLQHIIGHVEFYKRAFHSDARALVPRPEPRQPAAVPPRVRPPHPEEQLAVLGKVHVEQPRGSPPVDADDAAPKAACEKEGG